MGGRPQGGRAPPGRRRELAQALTRAALSPDDPQPVPFDYALWQLGQRMGVPPWVFEGHPIDAPPTEWVIRCLEFARMENSVTVKRSGKHG